MLFANPNGFEKFDGIHGPKLVLSNIADPATEGTGGNRLSTGLADMTVNVLLSWEFPCAPATNMAPLYIENNTTTEAIKEKTIHFMTFITSPTKCPKSYITLLAFL